MNASQICYWNLVRTKIPTLPFWLASNTDLFRGLSHIPARQMSADLSRKKRGPITADLQIWEVHFGPWEISRLTDLSLELQKRSERSHERWRPYSFKTNYSVNSQACVLVANLRISLKKITLEVKFAVRKSALLQNNNMWKKFCLCSVLQGNPLPLHRSMNNLMSKWHLIQPLQRNIQKPNAYPLDSRLGQKSLVTYNTLRSLYVCVWLVNTLTSTAPIGSPIICMWFPADICEQWERNLSFSSADVGGTGTRNEPLRTSAWEASFGGKPVFSKYFQLPVFA